MEAARTAVLATHGHDRVATKRLDFANKVNAHFQELYRWVDNQHQVLDANGEHYETELIGPVAAIEQILNRVISA